MRECLMFQEPDVSLSDELTSSGREVGSLSAYESVFVMWEDICVKNQLFLIFAID